jgi:mercuric ion transport protein
MTDNLEPAVSERPPARDTGALLIAAGGLAAAFGAASCCALPVLLGSFGLGSAWLAGIAWLAAPHQIALLIAAVVCLASSGAAFLWRRRVAACAPGAVCRRPITTAFLTSTLLAGAVLVVLGYLYA